MRTFIWIMSSILAVALVVGIAVGIVFFLEKRGRTLFESERVVVQEPVMPPVQAVTPEKVALPIDLSAYATKEDLTALRKDLYDSLSKDTKAGIEVMKGLITKQEAKNNSQDLQFKAQSEALAKTNADILNTQKLLSAVPALGITEIPDGYVLGEGKCIFFGKFSQGGVLQEGVIRMCKESGLLLVKKYIGGSWIPVKNTQVARPEAVGN